MAERSCAAGPGRPSGTETNKEFSSMTLIAFPSPADKGVSNSASNDGERGDNTKRVTPTLRVALFPTEGNSLAREISFSGRDAWFLHELVQAGARGVTAAEHPGTRISHYCFKLRRAGLVIDTEHEANSGIFRGVHGIYKLRSRIRVLKSVGIDDSTQRVRPCR